MREDLMKDQGCSWCCVAKTHFSLALLCWALQEGFTSHQQLGLYPG